MQALNAQLKDDEEKKQKAEQDLRLAREQAEGSFLDWPIKLYTENLYSGVKKKCDSVQNCNATKPNQK